MAGELSALSPLSRAADRAGRRLADEAAGALDDGRLTTARIGEQRCTAGSIVAALRLIGSGRGNVIPRV